MFDTRPAELMPHDSQANADTNANARALPQSQEFAKALRISGQNPMQLDRMQNMLVLRRKIFGRMPVAMINRAELQDPSLLFKILQEEGLRRTPVLLSPERPTPELARLGALPLMTPVSVAVLSLAGTSADRRGRLRQKWRNRLCVAERSDLRVTRQNQPLDADHWLLRADKALQKTRGYQSWPIGLTLAYAKANPGRAKLFQAHLGKEVVAGILVLTHAARATYHVAHSSHLGKTLNAHNLLVWNALEWLAAKRISTFDLGVINTEDAEGLARFKLGTGADVQKLGGTWVYWPPLGRSFAPLASLDLNLMRA